MSYRQRTGGPQPSRAPDARVPGWESDCYRRRGCGHPGWFDRGV